MLLVIFHVKSCDKLAAQQILHVFGFAQPTPTSIPCCGGGGGVADIISPHLAEAPGRIAGVLSSPEREGGSVASWAYREL